MTQPSYSLPLSLIYKAGILKPVLAGGSKMLPVKSAIQLKCALT